jgi:hypothetical protein
MDIFHLRIERPEAGVYCLYKKGSKWWNLWNQDVYDNFIRLYTVFYFFYRVMRKVYYTSTSLQVGCYDTKLETGHPRINKIKNIIFQFDCFLKTIHIWSKRSKDIVRHQVFERRYVRCSNMNNMSIAYGLHMEWKKFSSFENALNQNAPKTPDAE